ncbi:5524_t:CDS:2 [Ambispora gerdemannii]|uniref:5524_t:CDS:1 n=1 Tax=Ambispora gerdemannii TaxID=144530 RepID=A0A9N9FNE2_9GLOM|nr:5524_t:CDS:2 [Ambispora gerdemannii]
MGQIISNLSSEQNVEAKYRHYRNLAGEQARIRKQVSAQAQIAYKHGDGKKAKELSNKAKEHYKEMENYQELDLHGLFVTEALAYTEQRIQHCKSMKAKNLVIIVGQGNHSIDGVSKLKPAVTELINKYQIRCTPNKPNPGCLFLEFDQGKGDLSWFDRLFGSAESGCVIM